MGTNVQTVEAFYAATARGDLPGALAGLLPDARWTEMAGSPYGGTFTGAQAIVENVFMAIGGDWDDFACLPETIHDAGDTVVMTGWYQGICRKTRKPLRCRVAHVWRLAGGKIAAFEQFTDTKLFADAMR